jgi:hypothetical protein
VVLAGRLVARHSSSASARTLAHSQETPS